MPTTSDKIQKLEREIATLWRVIEDERLWHPSVIREIQRRSLAARRAYVRGRLRSAAQVFATTRQR